MAEDITADTKRAYLEREAAKTDPLHPDDCSCAIPCRRCGHGEEEHAGSIWGGSGPRRCLATGCGCKGAYIGDTRARCKQKEADRG